jgi:hypothetical protein
MYKLRLCDRKGPHACQADTLPLEPRKVFSRAEDVAQWYSPCLACQSPGFPSTERKRRGEEKKKGEKKKRFFY